MLRWGMLAASASALFAASPAHAGWVQAPGAHYLKVWDQILIGSQAFGIEGAKLHLPERYMDHALRLYFEYGVDEALTVVVRGTPIGIASYGSDAKAYSGAMAIGLRAALLRGELPLAIELAYGWAPPLGETPLAEGTIGGERFVYRPAFEQHLGQAELQLGWALPFGWARLSAGLTASTGDGIDPAFDASLRGGTSWSWGLEADLGLALHTPLGALEIVDVTGAGNTRYLGLTVGVGYWISDSFGLRLDLGLAPYARSNAATPSIGLGVQSR